MEIAYRVEMGARTRIRESLRDSENELRQMIVRVARSSAKDWLESKKEAERAALELAIPCKDGYSDHDFSVASLTTEPGRTIKVCSRCSLPEHWLMPRRPAAEDVEGSPS